MKAAYTGEPGRDWQIAKGPFEFVGRPGECVGEITFTNPTDDKIKIRRLKLDAISDKKRKNPTLEGAELAMQLRLQPRSAHKTHARLELPPATPPGVYEVHCCCGDQTELIRIQVLASPALAINPTHIKLRGASGDNLNCQVRIDNPGNIPMQTMDAGMIWLREQNWIGRTLVYSLREAADDENYEHFANRLLHDFKQSMIPPASVRLTSMQSGSTKKDSIQRASKQEGLLAPGEFMNKNLALIAPPGLEKGRTYLGFVKINMTRIWLELFCNGSPNSTKRR